MIYKISIKTFIYKSFGIETFAAKYRNFNVDARLHLLTTPLRVLVVNAENENYIEEIHYRNIMEITCVNPSVTISISQDKSDQLRQIEFKFSSKKAESFVSLVNEYKAIFTDIHIEKAQLIEEDKWKDPQGKDSKIILSCYNGTSSKDSVGGAFSANTTGRTLLKQLRKRLRLQEKYKDEKTLLLQANNTYEWIEPFKVLSQYIIGPNSKIYLVRTKTPVHILMTNRRKINTTIDIFKEFKLKFVFGFALWTIDPKTQKERALDPNFSIPYQTNKYDQLIFKRRFFQLSKMDIQTPEHSASVFYDYLDFLKKHKPKMDENLASLLAYDILYDTILDPSLVSKMKQFDYSILFPSFDKVTQTMIQLFKKRIESPKRPDAGFAQKNFMKNVRSVEPFGSERFDVMYAREGKTP